MMQAMAKIDHSTELPNISCVRKAAGISQNLYRKLLDSHKAHFALVSKYAERDDKGTFLSRKDEHGKSIPNSFVIPAEALAEWDAEIKKFEGAQVEVELPYGKLTTKDLIGVKLTPSEFATLSGLICR